MAQRRYVYTPAGFDLFAPTARAPRAGTVVVKVQPYGTPKNGTMGHCYVRPVDSSPDSTFALVLVNSLVPA